MGKLAEIAKEIAKRIKGLFSKNERLNLGVENGIPYNPNRDSLGIPVRDDNTGETIYFREPEDTEMHFKYPDGQETTLFVANIYRYNNKSNEAMILKGGKPVFFEVPLGTTLEQLEESGWLHYMLNQPAASVENLSSQEYNSLGRIDFQNKTIQETDPYVRHWIKQNLDPELQKSLESQRRAAEERHYENERIIQRNIQEMTQTGTEVSTQNILDPKFTGSPEKGFYELNSLQNGNIISLSIIGAPSRIQHRDGSIDYVYTAYRQDRESRTDVMILNSLGLIYSFLCLDLLKKCYYWQMMKIILIMQ